jgi:RNA polymerase sigma-70 factor (ECF subfamily)
MTDMTPKEQQDFVSKLTDAQNALAVYICILLGGDNDAAKDVLQETNVWLWQHAATFDPAKAPFIAWAKAQAYWKALQYRRDAGREGRLLVYDQLTFETIAATLAEEPQEETDVLTSLRCCLGKLSSDDRSFVEAHYFEGRTFQSLAEASRVSISALKMRMARLRQRLGDCVTLHVCAMRQGRDLL